MTGRKKDSPLLAFGQSLENFNIRTNIYIKNDIKIAIDILPMKAVPYVLVLGVGNLNALSLVVNGNYFYLI